MLGLFWCGYRGKRQTRKQWDAEWGRIGKEGNPWWLGSARANWEATMGAKVWMWFCEFLSSLPLSLHLVEDLDKMADGG